MLINHIEYMNNDLEVVHLQSASSSTISVQTGIWKCWFLRRGEKLAYPEKNHLEQRREPTTNSTHIIMASMPGLNPDLIGGRRAPLPLCHPCSSDVYIKQFFTVSDVPLAVKNYFVVVS